MSDLNDVVLDQWMRAVIPDFAGIDALTKFPGGQSNPTYKVMSGKESYVLRRKPFGSTLPSAHAVDREFRLLNALHPTGFPVPRPIAICTDAQVLGSIFYLMETVDGRSFSDGTLPNLPASERRAHYEVMVDAMAALHSIDHQTIGLSDFGPPRNYVARQVERWTRQYHASQTDDIPEVDALIEWLPRTVPEQTRTCVIHGDYRIDNLIYAPAGASIRAVIDWELATIGDPLADFAYFAMHWVMPRDGRAGLAGVDLDAQALPTLGEITQRYCAATGRDALPDLHWYFAYNLFRLVGIVQGIKKRFAEGNASSQQAEAMAETVLPLARLAWTEARHAGARP